MVLKIGKIKEKKSILLTGACLEQLYDGRINKQLISSLAKKNIYNIVSDLSKAPPKIDFNIYHFHNKFEPAYLSENTYFIILNSWVHSSIPYVWLETLKMADQIWVPSRYNKNCLKEVIDHERINILPVGINKKKFNEHIDNIKGISLIPTTKFCKFLFTGDICWYSGLDLLLKAYTDEFLPEEDVCLVIKGRVKKNKYSDEILNKISFYQSFSESPEIIYIPQELTIEELASLYRASTCVVYPYRTESVLLPVLESMFSCIPVITSDFGPSAEFCNDKNSYLLKTCLVKTYNKKVDGMDMLSEPVFGEINILELRHTLRQVYENYGMAKEKAKIAHKEIVSKYDMENTITLILQELQKIEQKPVYSPINQKYKNILLEGFDFLEKNDLLSGVANFNKVLEYDVNNSMTHLGLGSAYLILKEYEKAIQHLELSIKNNPYNLQAYQLMAIVFFNMDQKELSLLFFKKIAELKPAEPLIFERIGSIAKLIPLNTVKPKKYEYYKKFLNIKQSVSLCMITKNEENCIAKCLESIKNIFDEIIIIDTGSTDNTVEIAKSYNAKIYYFDWTGSFSDARNEYFKYASTDWIFYMDADEVLEEVTKNNLITLVQQATDVSEEQKTIYCYEIKIYNYLDENNKNNTIEHYAIRLFPNNSTLQFKGDIHEQLTCIIDDYTLHRIPVNDVTILHYGYMLQFKARAQKESQYFDILSSALKKQPLHLYYRFHLGIVYLAKGDTKKAIKIFSEVINICKETLYNSVYLPIVYVYLISSLNKQQRYTEAIEIGTDQVQCKDSPDYWVELGCSYIGINNIDKAYNCFQNALNLRYNDFTAKIHNISSLLFRPLLGIGEIYLQKGDGKKAELYLKRALKENQEFPDLKLKLARLSVNLGKYKQAEKYYLSLIEHAQFKKVAKTELNAIQSQIYSLFKSGLL